MTATEALPKGFALPDGWKIEWWGREENFLVIVASPILLKGGAVRRGGAVTIDLDARGFRSGWSASGSLATGMRDQIVYSGRGWKLALFTNAVAWLRSVIR